MNSSFDIYSQLRPSENVCERRLAPPTLMRSPSLEENLLWGADHLMQLCVFCRDTKVLQWHFLQYTMQAIFSLHEAF